MFFGQRELWVHCIDVISFVCFFWFLSKIERVARMLFGQMNAYLGWRKLVRSCERIVGGSYKFGSELK